MKLKETFRTIPQHYDRSRIGYPLAVFSDVISYAWLQKTDPILEVGAGTGIATVPFARTGNPLIVNDLSRSLLSVAKKKLKHYHNVQYAVGQYEDARLPKNYFALITSAQAFHWIKPSIRFTRTLQLLKKGGVVALFWNFSYYNKGVGRMAMRLHKKYARSQDGKANIIIDQLKRNRHFTGAVLKIYRRNLHMTKQEYINMQTSFSWYLALSETRKRQALAELKDGLKRFPDRMPMPIKTKLILARKK